MLWIAFPDAVPGDYVLPRTLACGESAAPTKPADGACLRYKARPPATSSEYEIRQDNYTPSEQSPRDDRE